MRSESAYDLLVSDRTDVDVAVYTSLLVGSSRVHENSKYADSRGQQRAPPIRPKAPSTSRRDMTSRMKRVEMRREMA